PPAAAAEEVVADGGGRLGRHGARPVLEGDETEVGHPTDRRGRVDCGTWCDLEIDAVVVEAQTRHGRGVPPGQIPGVPSVVDEGQRAVRDAYSVRTGSAADEVLRIDICIN